MPSYHYFWVLFEQASSGPQRWLRAGGSLYGYGLLAFRSPKQVPRKPVAHNHGLLSMNYGLLEGIGIVAYCFGLLGFQGSRFVPQ